MVVDETDDEAYNSWYSYEHVPERLAVPGFRRCRRFRAHGPGPLTTYLTMYDLTDLSVLTSPAYLERLNNPTPLTRATAPLSRLVARGAFVQHRRWNASGIGGVVAVSTLAVGVEDLDDSPEPLFDPAVEGTLGYSQALVGVSVLGSEPAAARARDSTDEGRISAGDDEIVEDLLVLEAASTAQLEGWNTRLAAAGLIRSSPARPWTGQIYRLMSVAVAADQGRPDQL